MKEAQKIRHLKSLDPENRVLIGWREWISLPELTGQKIRAKIDTGARSSCLHAPAYQIIERDGQSYARFSFKGDTPGDLPIIDFREVKDSGGHVEQRPFVRVHASIGDIEWEMDMSLTSRDGMRFPMLIGRTALAEIFLVDPSRSFIFGRVVKSIQARELEDQLDENAS